MNNIQDIEAKSEHLGNGRQISIYLIFRTLFFYDADRVAKLG